MMTRRLVALAAIALLVAACSSTGVAGNENAGGTGGELQAQQWVLRSYASEGALTIVPDDLYADADFRAQRVRGFAGCNDYDAVYRTGGRTLLISMPRLTLMSCGEVADAFQTSFITLLQQSRFYNVRDEILTIRGSDLGVLLVFDAAPANPLLGSWVVTSYADAGSVKAPLPGTELTTTFRLGKVGGSSGCNTFQGPYTTTGNAAAIGPLATTRIACADDVMAQETAFLAALQGVGLVERHGDELKLSAVRGGVLVTLAKPSALQPSPGPSGTPPVTAAPSASAAPTTRPSPTPTATATAAPTAAPTPRPTPSPGGSVAPTVAPPASLPPVATCALIVPTNVTVATISYPADWFTVTQPATVACRYFDPAPITVPTDPATLTTAVMIKADPAVSYQDALTAATNTTAWNVITNQPVTVSGLPATRLQTTSTAGSPGYPVGVTRYGYLIDLGGLAVWIETSGTVGSAAYSTNMSVVDLMASQSIFFAPVPA
jgi:heat shock protein HslJ